MKRLTDTIKQFINNQHGKEVVKSPARIGDTVSFTQNGVSNAGRVIGVNERLTTVRANSQLFYVENQNIKVLPSRNPFDELEYLVRHQTNIIIMLGEDTEPLDADMERRLKIMFYRHFNINLNDTNRHGLTSFITYAFILMLHNHTTREQYLELVERCLLEYVKKGDEKPFLYSMIQDAPQLTYTDNQKHHITYVGLSYYVTTKAVTEKGRF